MDSKQSQNELVSEADTDYGKSSKLPQYLAALSVCMGSVAAGTVLAWTATIGDDLQKGSLNDIVMSEDDIGWIGSLVTLGAMVICFPIGMICDWLGRKLAMLLLIVPFTLGWLLIIFATSVEMVFVGRFFTGLAGGAFCVSAPMYTSEIAEKEIRGGLGSYFQLLLTVGILLANVLGYAVPTKGYTIICACIPLAFGVVFFLQPETPVYLLKRGKEQEARASLKRLRGSKYNVEAELKDIQAMLDENEQNKMPFFQSLKKRATKKAFMISFGLMFFQQMSGINAVIFYTSIIFKSAGASLDPRVAAMIVGVCQVVSTYVSSLVVDKLGRRFLLILSDSVMALGTLVLGIYFSLKERELVDEATTKDLGWLPIISLCVFIIVFSIGYGPIPWMISSEVYPPEVKSIASSLAGMFNWLLAFIVTKSYGPLSDKDSGIGGDGAFYFFTGFSIIGTLFVIFLVPETKGKTLDEIQRELSGEKNVDGVDNKAFS